MNSNTTFVTKPTLPPLEELIPSLTEIWDNRILTNGGPFHERLEKALCDYLGVRHICLFTNAPTALVIALQALRITGEVITTPYSFVATSHSLIWNGIKPIFVDMLGLKPLLPHKQRRSCQFIVMDIRVTWML